MIRNILLIRSQKQHLIKAIVISLVILIAAGLRIARLPFITMWSDEYHTFRVSSHKPIDILSGNYSGELNPPLYFFILHFYRFIFGDSEIAMRSLSLFLSILSMFLLYMLSYSIFKSFVPSVAALVLMAFNPILIYYSVEIRSYALLVFLCLLSFLSCITIQEKTKYPEVWTILLTLSMSSCLYTHHFGLIIPITISAFVITKALIFRKWSRRIILSLISVAISIVIYLPGFIVLQRQATSYPGQSNFTDFINTFQIFAVGLTQPQVAQALTAISTVSFSIGMIILFSQIRNRPTTLLVIWGIAITIIFVFLANIAEIQTINRYLIVTIPLVFIAIAATLIQKKKWYRGVNILGLITIIFSIVYGTNYVLNTKNENLQASWKANWMHLSEIIREIRRTQEPIAILGWDATPIQYYLGEFALTSFILEEQYPNNLYPSYLIVMTPNSRTLSILESADLIYEDNEEGISILRLYTRIDQ